MAIDLHAPYLVFLADIDSHVYAKTGLGLARWCPEKCLGQLRLSEHAIDAGLPDMDIATAVAKGARSLILGVAPVGGAIQPHWISVLFEAADSGLDIVSGLHSSLTEIQGLADAARTGGGRLVDVRVAPDNLSIATGHKRPGRRVLTVGTDCSVGKKYTALALLHELQRRGVACDFRATGQTGIMIGGQGMPIDATVCDFAAGAAEALSPANRDEHWDVIEGQGSLFHPAYAGVSLALLHGSQPDAIVLCHEAGRESMAGYPEYSLPTIRECIELNLQMGRRTNPDLRCVGVSVNTMSWAGSGKEDALAELSVETGLICVDPLIQGLSAIVDEMLDLE